MSGTLIRVMLLDDHSVIRQGLAMAINLQNDMMVCAQCSCAASAIEEISKNMVDVILVDISLEGGADGFDFIKAIHSRYKSVRTLVLSMHDEVHYAEKAVLTGSMGYITKKESIETIISGIRDVMKGNIFVSGDMSGKLIKKLVRSEHLKDEDDCQGLLTPREMEIFNLIGAGNTPKDIARELYLSVHTVETHRRNIKEKLGLASSRELVKYAIKKKDG